MMKHAPGPWRGFEPANGYGLTLPNDQVFVFQRKEWRDLALAAPDLFDACELGLQELKTYGVGSSCEYAIDEMIAAIAKAKGE